MSLVELRRVFEKRRYNLIQTLESNKEEIDLSKQHQMYGAVREIENFLKAIDYHREKEVNSNTTITLKNEVQQTFLKKINLKFKSPNDQ
ncbi:MAG: hypothetical protein ABIC91_06280 [Nanoarchaeota archaeon]|nr:hypothetical protein [Nanoarchaeota archaeon]MBU1030381.1 hypothetical protein [Nanoarchaeota archaeon]MBU1850278.1 hypothetical protein [Nanoarchaeota archaeon]